MRGSTLGALVAALCLMTGAARAGEPASDEIVVGMSTALTGPSQALGQGMQAGVDAYFRLVNEAGGVKGRKLRLLALDDGYEPAKVGPNMRRLIDNEHAFAILGNVGTPTAVVAVPIVNERKVPFFGAFTGAPVLRKTPPDRYVVNFRASYAEETSEMVRGLTKDLGIKPSELAFFTQNDAYGDAGYEGAIKALHAMGYAEAEELPHGRYPRNSVDVEDALSRIVDPKANAKAVIMVGTYKPCAKFIRLAKKLGLSMVFANVSFVGSEALLKELGQDGEGVVVTQVVPHYDGSSPVLAEYRSHIAGADVNFVSLEGFLAAKAFVAGLTLAGPNPTRESFLDALESGAPIDVGIGPTNALSKINHQVSSRVWPTVIRGGRFASLASWAELRNAQAGRRP